MTPKEIALLKSSWQRAARQPEQVAALFFTRLFELEPALKHLFRGDMTVLGRKFMQVLNMVVCSLDRLDELPPPLGDMGRRHRACGVKDRDYDTAGLALLWAVQQRLGDDYTPEVQRAWTSAYGTLASVMRRAAALAA